MVFELHMKIPLENNSLWEFMVKLIVLTGHWLGVLAQIGEVDIIVLQIMINESDDKYNWWFIDSLIHSWFQILETYFVLFNIGSDFSHNHADPTGMRQCDEFG
jgi:hypothetical protein